MKIWAILCQERAYFTTSVCNVLLYCCTVLWVG